MITRLFCFFLMLAVISSKASGLNLSAPENNVTKVDVEILFFSWEYLVDPTVK